MNVWNIHWGERFGDCLPWFSRQLAPPSEGKRDFCPYLALTGSVIDASGKEPACQCRRCKRHGFDPWVGKIPWRRARPTLLFLPGESHGQRSLVGYGPWVAKSLTWLKRLSTRACNFGCPHSRKKMILQIGIKCSKNRLSLVYKWYNYKTVFHPDRKEVTCL